jgi:site-specific DNA recombinase
MAITLDGYVRVSRVGGRDQTDGFISPDVQQRAILEWAERNGANIVMQPHELNVSGGTMDRPVFNTILERIRSGQSNGLVVFKLDRFARTLIGAVNVLEELGRHEATFASATEPQLDYTTPAGRAFVQQLFVFAEFTRSTLKESWATSQRYAIERGIHISPNGFLGYEQGPGRRLVPNQNAPLAVEMFRRRGAGESWGSIADWLNAVAPKDDDREWTGLAVARTCSKRVYRGEASRYVVQDKDGRGPVVNREAHPALVTEEEWRAAQAAPRAINGGHPDGTPYPLLSGLVRCAGCRFVMSQSTGFKDVPMYRCRRKHASGSCPEPAMISADTIEEYVERMVLDQLAVQVESVPDSRERDQVASERDQAREDLDGFRRDIGARRKLGAEWHSWLDEYLQRVRGLEADLAALDQRIGVASSGFTEDAFRSLGTDERRAVLSGYVDAIMVRRSRGRGRHTDPLDRRIRVLWRGEAPEDLPRRRVVNAIKPFVFDEPEVAAGMVAP